MNNSKKGIDLTLNFMLFSHYAHKKMSTPGNFTAVSVNSVRVPNSTRGRTYPKEPTREKAAETRESQHTAPIVSPSICHSGALGIFQIRSRCAFLRSAEQLRGAQDTVRVGGGTQRAEAGRSARQRSTQRQLV